MSAMNEGRSRFVENGEHSRELRDGARESGGWRAVGRSAPVGVPSQRAGLGRPRSARGGLILAVLVVAALAAAAFVLGRLRASSVLEPASARQHVPERAASSNALARAAPAQVEAASPQRRELALIPFVSIEVEPADGEIWLDRKVAGVGSVQLGAINDGMLHELRFVAPEHETKTLIFRNVPPAGRVILKRIVRKEAAAPSAPSRVARNEARARHADEPARVDNGAAAPAPARARPSVIEAPHDARPVPDKTPRVQLIEVRIPRVEVLD